VTYDPTMAISNHARKLLKQIAESEHGSEKIEIENPPAKELLDEGLIEILDDERGSAAVGQPERWVKVTDRGRDTLTG
jgi:hypothetical protein